MGWSMIDKTALDGQVVERAADTLDLSLAERIRRAGGLSTIPQAPAGAQARAQRSGEDLEITIPGRPLRATEYLGLGLLSIFLVFFAGHPALPIAGVVYVLFRPTHDQMLIIFIVCAALSWMTMSYL